jgi:dTDP-4-dehydrorhamnose 3,5-epimerase
MQIEKTILEGCFIVHDKFFGDARGYFFESYNRKDFYRETGLDITFVQDNQSNSQRGVLRGLHYQTGEAAQAKLVRVLKGTVLDVAIDLRKASATFGQHVAVELSGDSHTQLFVPRGFAHGFVVLSEEATFFYKCDNYYDPSAEAESFTTIKHLRSIGEQKKVNCFYRKKIKCCLTSAKRSRP